MEKNSQNMEVLSQQIKRNNRWRRVGLITLLGIFVVGAIFCLTHYLGAIVGIIASMAAFVAKLLTNPVVETIFETLMLVINSVILLFCLDAGIKMADDRSKFFNHTAVKWGREWLLESHDFRNDEEAHQFFYQAVFLYPALEIIAATIALSEASYFVKLLLFVCDNTNTGHMPLIFTNRAMAISFSLAVLIKLGATIWHMLFQYSLKEYPQAFIDKVKHDIDGDPYNALEPVISSVWSSPVPLIVVWSILQMPPKHSEKNN